MRSYDQYCALARALDVIGDRWVLLIVRELLEKPCRYGDLQANLPGIATNLLAARLRSLQADGVIEHRDDGTYALTAWGAGLHDAVYALGRWAIPLMVSGPTEDDFFRSHWMRHMVVARFDGFDPARRALTVELHTGDAPMTLMSEDGRVRLETGTADAPDVTVSGPPHVVIGALIGRLDADAVRAAGGSIVGDARKLRRLRPLASALPT